MFLQIKCFSEIINIGYVVYKSHDLPWFRTLSWYFLISSNYFFYGESLIQYFGVLLSRDVSFLFNVLFSSLVKPKLLYPVGCTFRNLNWLILGLIKEKQHFQ